MKITLTTWLKFWKIILFFILVIMSDVSFYNIMNLYLSHHFMFFAFLIQSFSPITYKNHCKKYDSTLRYRIVSSIKTRMDNNQSVI